MNSIVKHFISYKYSLRGLRKAITNEQAMWFHVAAVVIVLALDSYLQVSRMDWLITLLLVGIMLMAEMFNTAVEKLANRVTREQDPLIADVKDIASGAVLVMGLSACICTVIIYLPYLQ